MSYIDPKYKFPNKYSNISFLAEEQTEGNYVVCKLKKSVQSTTQASLSPLLTLSAYIVTYYKSLKPPGMNQIQIINQLFDRQFPNEYLSLNYLMEPWCDYISNLVIQNKVYQENQTIYLFDLVPKSYIQQLKTQTNLFQFYQVTKQEWKKLIQQKKYDNLIQKVFNLQQKAIEKNTKFAIICFGTAYSQDKKYNPKVHMPALAFGIYYRQTDIWKTYKILNNQSPNQEQFQSFDGYILSGSPYSVYDHIPQIDKFMNRLIEAFRKNNKMKILGFCFGHQSIGEFFGGHVQSMKKRVINLQNIKMDWKLIKQNQLDYFKIPNFQINSQFLNASECHGDHVSKVPQGFIIIGRSESCQNEAMASLNKRVLSFQFHIEFMPEFAKAYQLRIQKRSPNLNHGKIYILGSNVKSTQKSIKDTLYLRQVTRKFLDQEFMQN